MKNKMYKKYITVPDSNFKKVLVQNGISCNKEGEISLDEAETYTEVLNVSGYAIKDLTSIEAFTNLKALYCANNELTTLNLSSNLALINLEYNNNSLIILDVSSNKLLTSFYCYSNSLIELNIANANNINMEMSATNLNYLDNPNLKTITVDNEVCANANWNDAKPITTGYSTNLYAIINN